LEYSWNDIQDYVTNLPIERIITIYEGKNANNQERYMEALCNKDVAGGTKALDDAAEAFTKRLAEKRAAKQQ
jgi:hypothetical protein